MGAMQYKKEMPLDFGDPRFFGELVQRFSAPGSNSAVHVLLHSTNGQDAQDVGAAPCLEPFEVADRLWICRMPDAIRDLVYGVCEPHDEPHVPSFRQYGQLYTVALFLGPWAPGVLSSWDGYGFLSKFVALSHLLHPTSIGFGNTAVLTFGPTGELRQSSPGPCRGITEHAFTVPDTRNWLSRSECELIKTLYNSSDLDQLPDRVARAHWNLQRAVYEFFFEVRALLIASALDALLHVRLQGRGRVSTGAQFKSRLILLARELGIPFTDADAKAVWDYRSDVSHGRDPWKELRDAQRDFQIPHKLSKSDRLVSRYLACEQVLRSTILKCLSDPSFAAKFASDDTVEKAFPI